MLATSAQTVERVIPADPAMQTIVLVCGLGIGVFLWALGRRIVKPAAALVGLLGGAATAFGFARAGGATGLMLLAIVAGGAVTSAIVAGTLFRFWAAFAMAVLFAVLAPMAALVFEGPPETKPEPAVAADTVESPEAAALAAEAAATSPEPATRRFPASLAPRAFAGRDEAEALAREQAEAQVDRVAEEVAVQAEQTWADFVSWAESQGDLVEQGREAWEALGAERQRTVRVAAAAGAVLGLVWGLALPYSAAALASAVLGSVLIWLCGSGVLIEHVPAVGEKLPAEPRTQAVIIGLITLAGVVVQWLVFRKRTDK